jgi:hypothetical protein
MTNGVGQRFDRVGVGNGIAGPVKLGVEGPEGQGALGLAQEHEAHGAKLTADEKRRVLGGRG